MKLLQLKDKDFIDDVFDSMVKSPMFSLSSKMFKMPTDIREENGYYYFEVELPGYKKEEITIEISKDYMIVSAEKSTANSEKKGNYIRKERNSCSCSRTYYVGNVSESEIVASLQDGILYISFPSEDLNKENIKIQIK